MCTPACRLTSSSHKTACHTDNSLCPTLFPCRVETLSWSPRAFVYHNFASAVECKHIMQLAKPMVGMCATGSLAPHKFKPFGKLSAHVAPPVRTGSTCLLLTHLAIKSSIHLQMRRSTVVGAEGKSVQDNIRTSYGAFIK